MEETRHDDAVVSGGISSNEGNLNNNNNNNRNNEDPHNWHPTAEEFVAAMMASLNNTDPATMMLSNDEIERALEIKEAIQNDERLIALSDFECVQYALTTPGESMEQVCERAFCVQSFRELYRIDDTIEQGVELFHQYTVAHPGVMLAVEFLPTTQNYISIEDYAAFFPATIRTHNQYRTFLGAVFYCLQCKSPNFTAIRNGVSCMAECDGAGFSNFDATCMDKLMQEIYNPYPKNVKETFFLNAPTIAVLTYALWKRYLPDHVRRKFQVGHRIEGMEGQRIDGLYKTPTPEAARQHCVRKVLEFLYLRYTNQKSFVLSRPAADGGADAIVGADDHGDAAAA